MFGDEIWDEDRWEAFLRENDKRIDRYMDLLFTFMNDNPPPDLEDTAAREGWEQALRDFLRSNGLRQDDAFLDLFAEPDPEEDADWLLGAADQDEAAWQDDFDDFRNMPLYKQAFGLATSVLEWSNQLPGDVKNSTLVQFCSNITQVPANIAKGHGIGYEQDTIGGNIACVKRALTAANAALDLLRELKPEPFVEGRWYRSSYEQLFEVRNAVGLYVQELRHRFNLGID